MTKQATWGGRFSQGPSALMQQFSESVSFDQRLAPFDIQCSCAHAQMLAHVGLITKSDAKKIVKGLKDIGKEIAAGTFTWDISLEDVHMNIEQELTRRVPAAAQLHTARSRNDQVATDMRLFFKDACQQLSQQLQDTLSSLVTLAQEHQDQYLPGYTHLQRAQPVSWAHYLLAYVEMFHRDHQRFEQLTQQANSCPLGSGAIAGTTLPIDRAYTAQLLGFVDSKGKAQVTRNSMDAVADRDLFIEFLHHCALCATHISRIAEDFILWNSSEFGYVQLPDAFTTGSSLMPQKKNPDSFELLRGKSARMTGHLSTLLQLTKGLPLTYNRDLQDDKPPVFDAFDQLSLSLAVLSQSLSGVRINKERCAQATSDPLLLATDLADYLVRLKIPFRQAHHIVGDLVALAEKTDTPLHQLSLEQVQKICPQIKADWTDVFDLKTAMQARENTGMPGPKTVAKELKRWKKVLEV